MVACQEPSREVYDTTEWSVLRASELQSCNTATNFRKLRAAAARHDRFLSRTNKIMIILLLRRHDDNCVLSGLSLWFILGGEQEAEKNP